MKKIVFALLVVFAASAAIAENSKSKTEAKSETKINVVSLSGNVIDEVSGEALVGVEVAVEGSNSRAYTDFDGHFVIENLKPGDFKLVASYTSYNKTEKKVKLGTQSNQVKIELKHSH